MDPMVSAGIGGVVVLIIREIAAALLQLRGQSTENERKERTEFEARMQRYLKEAEEDRDEARKERDEEKKARETAFKAQIECEKNTIRLEAKVELLTRLSGIDLQSSGIKATLLNLEREAQQKKQEESKSPDGEKP